MQVEGHCTFVGASTSFKSIPEKDPEVRPNRDLRFLAYERRLQELRQLLGLEQGRELK